ncbi:putative transcription factor C3H family [Helianthus annuus]|uniref:Transcription factor C3H family n=1 Tax=Helianthus annuus TaxID=4232 RepID=A0A9K3HXY1_HELAN|nr:putative transcription factor C3H family [Helianthus annuus]KAJ0513733.1 putative transcription factor C3H family [Helianthus annuus]KAJ0521638.1 putative transcription factor C3H family [Helianthus annuus]KAJ0529837.1 putative transcription factor C3H family [Helianthus annuus]KAJ0696711.1 putative transcription factor C3H family [Helianthus annuus]
MEDWDLETLEKVVESKGKEYNQNKPTDIVCKHFLNAMEKKQYGWFWVCPNGNKECHYRHALPPEYILKSQMKALLEEEANKLAIEDEIKDQVLELAGDA